MNMKYQPRDRNPVSEILAEFAVIAADVARERSIAAQAIPLSEQPDKQERPAT
jgi:hypothetical protein